MNSFSRVIRIALSYRWNFLLSLLCALGVAIMWGGNITAVYPLVEVVLDGKSTSEWLDGKIANSQHTIQTLETKIETLQQPGDPSENNAAEITRLESQVRAENKAISRYQYVEPYIDHYAPAGPFQTLVWVCLFILIGTLLKNALRIAGQILVSRISFLTTFELRKDFYRHILQMDMSQFQEQKRGEVMARFTSDINLLSGGIQTLLGQAITEPLKALVCLGGAATISWRLLLLTLIVAPLAGYLINRLAKSLKRANRRALTELAGIYETLSDTLANIKIIKAFTMESQQRRSFHISSKNYYKKSMKIAVYDSLVSPLTEIAGMGMIVLAILAGGYIAIMQETHIFGFLKISDRELSKGDLMLFFAMLAGVSDPA